MKAVLSALERLGVNLQLTGEVEDEVAAAAD
jgi:hypothetical protein